MGEKSAMATNAIYMTHQYAAIKGWAAIDALEPRTRRAKRIAVQRRVLRDECTLRDANGEVVPFDAFNNELREEMKHTNSLTGVGGILAVLVAWGVTTIEEH